MILSGGVWNSSISKRDQCISINPWRRMWHHKWNSQEKKRSSDFFTQYQRYGELSADWRGEMDASRGDSVTEWGRQSGSNRLGVWGAEIRRKVDTPDLAEVPLTNHPAHFSAFICYLLLSSCLSSLLSSCILFSDFKRTADLRCFEVTVDKGSISNPMTDTKIMILQPVEFNVTYYSVITVKVSVQRLLNVIPYIR